jgi:recombination protein RecA
MNVEAMKVAALLNKKFKRDLVIMGNTASPLGRLPTGSLSLDVVLGGGWPLNRWVELIGDPSHGKTALALKTIAHNQAVNPDFTAVWVAAEEYDVKWSEALGVDNNRLILIETNIMEEAYQAVLDFAESKTVDMVVIDSLPALVPTSEEEKDSGEMTVGRGALITNQFFRKAMTATKREPDGSERPILGVVINQWRLKIGVMHGDPRTTPGGVGKDYAYSVRAEVKRDEWIEIGPSGNKTRIGQTIRIRTIKNKTAPPQSSAFIDFYFADGGPVPKGSYDFGKETIALAILNGIVERRGGWYYYGERKWQGAEVLVDSIREELDLKDDLERQVLDSLKNSLPVAASEE